ncbi:MAG: cation transporter [Leptolyngbyaceae cyanobacterium SM1_1_3]|nr:cation transporter [Leptolyngbyaceae cyanobacterium SM1_1_3]NJN01942.1 cation transporter [Leptolyngbyaceae cyanobacterium RM1_1_2]NJO10229.1 cation transporter [Leptolyngbyaceae cyanobacterium SL_1_1]
MQSCSPRCSHFQSAAPKTKLLIGAIAFAGSFAGFELLAGRFSHSLALIADSGHMLADTSALGLALIATWLARWATRQQTRIEGTAALINSISLVVMAGMIAWEALRHLQAPPSEILSSPMLVTALVGLGVNCLNLYWLHQGSQQDLNLRGAFLHVVADTLSSVGVIFAAIAVAIWQCTWVDSLVGLLVSGLIAVSAVPLIFQSWRAVCDRPAPAPDTSALLAWDVAQFSQQIKAE